MKVEIVNYSDQWQAVKDAAMNTIGIESGKYPTEKWKRKMLLAEHSPIRLIELTVRITDIPYWVSVHFTRHKIGIEHFVSTQRTDRTGENRNEKPQSALVDYTFRANATSLDRHQQEAPMRASCTRNPPSLEGRHRRRTRSRAGNCIRLCSGMRLSWPLFRA